MSFIEMEQTISCQQLEIEDLREQVAAQAAVIEKLREALIYAHDEAASLFEECTGEDFNAPLINEALAIPTDSTQILAEARRAERERCAKVCEAFSEDDDAMDRQVKAQCAKLILAME